MVDLLLAILCITASHLLGVLTLRAVRGDFLCAAVAVVVVVILHDDLGDASDELEDSDALLKFSTVLSDVNDACGRGDAARCTDDRCCCCCCWSLLALKASSQKLLALPPSTLQ